MKASRRLLAVSGFATSRRVAAAIAACALALGLGGCGLLGGRAKKDPGAPELLLAYTSKVAANIARLEELDRGGGDADLEVVADTRDAIRGALAKFQRLLREYDKIVSKPRSGDACKVDAIETAVRECDSLVAGLREQAVQISLLADAVAGQYDSARLAAEASGGSKGLAATQRYLAASRALAAQTAAVGDYLSAVHRGVLESGGGAPCIVVFHFLRLERLERSDPAPHALRFELAWKEWVEKETQAGVFDGALRVLSLVSRLSREHRPRSLQSLFDISAAALGGSPTLEMVERMESSLANIESVFPPEGAFRRALVRARAAITFCRARVTEDPDAAAALAGDALKRDHLLADRVAALLVSVARRAGDRRLDRGEYSEAVAACARCLAYGSVPGRERRVARYRDRAVTRALSDAKREIDRREFKRAQEILSRATRAATRQRDRKRVREAFSWYYEALTADLLRRDVERAISVGREALRLFPRDRTLVDGVDRGLYILLERKIGDIASSCDRLGAEGVLALMKSTVKEMRGTVGPALCEALLGRIEAAWARRARMAKDPHRIFHHALEAATLSGARGKAARQAAAATLWKRIDAAAAGGKWTEAGKLTEAYFDLCPDVERPPEFKDRFAALIDHLDRSGDAVALGRHLAIFIKAYPAELGRVRSILVSRMQPGRAHAAAFRSLLESAEPGAPELASAAPPAAGSTEDDGAIASFAAEGGLGDGREWWTEGDDDESGAAAMEDGMEDGMTDGDGGGSPAGAPLVFGPLSVAGGIAGGIISAAALVLVIVFTLKKRTLPFQWYAAVAVVAGLTVGFVLGARTPPDPAPAGRAAPEQGGSAGGQVRE